MKKLIIAAVLSLVVLTSAFECGASTDGSTTKKNPPQVTTVTGNLIVSKSNSTVTGYKKWKTNFLDTGPYGEDFDAGNGSYRVAGFCVPANREVKGKVTNGFGFEFEFTMKPGDCKQIYNLDEARITVKET